jgi:hypothetical protein
MLSKAFITLYVVIAYVSSSTYDGEYFEGRGDVLFTFFSTVVK